MPNKNHFRHQQYKASEPKTPWRQIYADFPPQPDTTDFSACRNRFDKSISRHIDAIYLVHGTFAGNDALGWFSQLEKVMPAAGPVLKKYGKKLTDMLAGDDGNYTPKFQSLFPPSIPTRRFVWSGENTHSGRSKAAIELLDELLSRVDVEGRVLLWTHSHAANVVALITNLIAAEHSVQLDFLRRVQPLFSPTAQESDSLSRVENAVDSQTVNQLQLDIVNFGSPITYGWDTAGYRKLIHIVNHVPIEGRSEWLCPPSAKGNRAEDGQRGDLVQILGITGSDFFPWLLNSKTRASEKVLHQFLAPDCSRRDWWARASIGMRVAEEGETVLVNYQNQDKLATATFGHTVYTRPQWLSFHMELISDFYDSVS